MKLKLRTQFALFALFFVFTVVIIFIFAEELSLKNEESFAGANDSLPAWVAGSIANGIPF